MLSPRRALFQLDAARPGAAAPLGWRCFQLGVFVLPSSALIAGVLLLVALVLGSQHRRPPLADRANGVLLLVAGLMVLGCGFATSGWLAWVGLANWLPFFWAFWGFQPYLATPAARRRLHQAPGFQVGPLCKSTPIRAESEIRPAAAGPARQA